MASPPPAQAQVSSAAPAAPTAARPTTSPPPPPAAASHPLPRAFLATSSPRGAAVAPAPPLFTGRPLKPNPPDHASVAPHGILYPVSTSSAAQHRRVSPVAVGVGYPRAHAVAVPIAQSQQPRSFAAVPRALVAGVAARPEQPPRGVPIAPQPKVNPVPLGAPSGEQSNSKDRERSREDSTVVVINDRKLKKEGHFTEFIHASIVILMNKKGCTQELTHLLAVLWLRLTCWTVSQDPCTLSVGHGCVMVFHMKVSQALEMANHFFQDLCLRQSQVLGYQKRTITTQWMKVQMMNLRRMLMVSTMQVTY